MHIVKFTFECGGFDFEMMRGGMSLSAWNTAREFAAHGHRVSIVTPAHGRIGYLREKFHLEEVEYSLTYDMPLLLDREVWPGFPAALTVPLTTRAHRMTLDGVDIYFLSNDYLDLLSDRFYPPKTSEGHELSYFKPLVFQIDGIRFIETMFGGEQIVVQAYEPLYHYLLALAFRDSPHTRVVSTVASNMPINQKVYRPQVQTLLDLLSVAADLDAFADREAGTGLDVVRGHIPSTHLHSEYGPDYVGVFSMVVTSCDLVNFLSEGQKDFYSTFRDTPFEDLFRTLTVSRLLRENAHKFFVGGCAISDAWLGRDPGAVDRNKVLTSLGLDPELPTFYHSSRYSVHHKGQVEMMRAIDRVLASDRGVNFVVRCLLRAGASGSQAAGNTYFQEVAERYPGNVFLDWRMVDEDTLFDQASSADFCLFPSKFELDTFLIAQGEAMACGAVPIATAQEGTRHFGHHRDTASPEATGFPLDRSFREDDPLLADDLVSRIRQAAAMFREDAPAYERLSANARRVARGFTWERAARRHLEMFALIDGGGVPELSDDDALRYGWFDRLSEKAWSEDRERVSRAAITHGDLAAYRRCGDVDDAAVSSMFRAAYNRGRFETCHRLAAGSSREDLMSVLRERCRLEQHDGRWSVDYHFPDARRVDVFLPAAPDAAAADSARQPHTLARRGASFTGAFPGAAPAGTLHFLLTLSSGRFVWDRKETAS
ncbi:glycogen/starch synthase [Streptomyces cocklensis]|uniref:D-inositol 3-phosphate glycosyltransferase n=1 Tax=Actinacidiphila cocklensis TaxID=887465 RepID=A0A9W4GRR4_9ACTN|nr:glycogen/starch synthase [Actinacidiphila cocklensis]MDD1060781.1 glycogen/starch synthase [Actinacidiphila cocklensis]CAG6394652.1 Glycosyl transferase [Actinacidiphila cocklensis]